MLILIRIAFLLVGVLVANPQDHAFAQMPNPEIDRLFSEYSGQGDPGAAVMVIKDGTVIYRRGYGAANLEASERVTSRTNFRLASLTKQFTAMAIMLLESDGQLSFEDTLTDLIAGFPTYGSRITVRHLLNHTSGLKDYEELIPAGTTDPLLDGDVVRILTNQRQGYFLPGSEYRYSNSGYATLAHIVATVSGRSFAGYLQERVFLPLGMQSTVAFEEGISSVTQRAFGYSPSGSSFTRTDQSLTSSVLGDGGIYTSIDDYFFWDQALYSDKLLSFEKLSAAFLPGRLNSGSPIKYGFGWMLDTYRGQRMVSHTGSTIGFRSAVQRFPDQRLTVVVLVNRNNAAPWDKVRQIVDMFLQ